MVDFTKPLQTAYGNSVRYLGVLNEGKKYEAHLVVVENTWAPEEVYYEVNTDGKSVNSGKTIVKNAPEKHVYWVNFYPEGLAVDFKTKEQADNCSSYDRIACVRVEFSEGDGLE